MGKLNKIGYSLKDVTIVPSTTTSIKSRSECNPYITICEHKSYPIFVAPMASVTDEKNYNVWIDNKLSPVIPRSVGNNLDFSDRLKLAETCFVSFSLSESKKILEENISNGVHKYICIDLANGHMSDLIHTCMGIKKQFGDEYEIMTGNIANPVTYVEYCKAGIDWVRCSIGSGSRCTSSANVGIHYPMATLLDNILDEKRNILKYNSIAKKEDKIHITKIIADGGIYNFDDINKCLAIGADTVMIGRAFAECEEACGPILYCFDEVMFSRDIGHTKDELDSLDAFTLKKLKPYRNYYGMSTKYAQSITGGTGNKTAEGISKPVEVKYPVAKWVDNMESYLKSAMSYTDSFTIEQFKRSEIIILGGSGDFSYRK